jgi:hypothetical protein
MAEPLKFPYKPMERVKCLPLTDVDRATIALLGGYADYRDDLRGEEVRLPDLDHTTWKEERAGRALWFVLQLDSEHDVFMPTLPEAYAWLKDYEDSREAARA